MNTKEDQLTMIEDCVNRESKLSDWEMSFIESVENWLASGRSLTQKQDVTLEVIWEKVTSKG